jgi:hypothetical protein
LFFAFDGYNDILATTYNKSSGFGCMYNMEICFEFPCKSHSFSSLSMVNEWLLHGNQKQISMLYIQPNPMDLFYVVARIIIIATTCKNSCTIFLPG